MMDILPPDDHFPMPLCELCDPLFYEPPSRSSRPRLSPELRDFAWTCAPNSDTMTTENQKHILEANKKYVETFDPEEIERVAPGPEPVNQLLIITCMDARIDPNSAFGILLGSAHIIRNAGASARDALRSIVVSQQLMHTREIVVIKHTHCGLQKIGAAKGNPTVRRMVAAALGPEAARELAGLNFDGFDDVDAAVREDVEFLRKCKVVPDDVPVSGWVYETEVGRVRKVL